MRRIIFSSIIALVAVSLLTAGYFFYRRYAGDVAEAIRAVPPDAAFVIECRNAQSTLFHLRQAEYWQSLTANASMKQFGETLLHMDSVFTADADFAPVWKSKPIVISAHITKSDDFDWLFLFEVPRGTNEADATNLVKKIFSISPDISRHEHEGVFINDLTLPGKGNFSFALDKGILMCSHTSFLVEYAVRQLKNGTSLKSNKSFFNVYKTSGKNTDADLYFNYKSFSRFLGIFSSQDAATLLSLTSSFAEWSEADIRFNATSVLLNGYSSLKDTSQLMSVMKNQQPQEMRMPAILPARTAYLFHVGISDSKTFFDRLQFSSFGGGQINEKPLQQLKGENKVSLKKNLTSWVGNEMALVITESNTARYNNNTFACIQARDKGDAMKALKEICTAMEPVKGTPCKTELYNGHEIGLIKAEGILKIVYGKLFEGIQKNYFTSVGNYIVFANQASALRSFIDDADNKKTLSTEHAFKQVIANAESSSNIFVYLDFPRSWNIIKSFSSGTLFSAFDDAGSLVTKVRSEFSALALQYSNKDNLVSNHFVLQFSEEVKKYASMVWSAECDTSVHMKPQVVTDGSSSYFMVQDDANRLYLFESDGQLVWKKEMGERIMSDIYSVDFFHNGTKQFLFNTASSLYFMDKSGAYMGNFPIRFPAPASNGCAVADFDNNGDYKIIVACTNQMLYAYEMNGKAMNGWLYNKPVGDISLPVKHFKVKGKDYLFVATVDGRMELLDRRGALRTRVAGRIVAGALSNVVAVDTGEAGSARVVLADSTGNIFAVYTDGHTRKVFSNNLRQPVFFDVADINDDNKGDYVLFGGNTLSVQQAESDLLFSHEFREAISGISVAVSGDLVGSISTDVNKLTIYNSDGSIYPGFPVKGSTPFTVTPLNKDGKKYVAVGSVDGNFYLYVME